MSDKLLERIATALEAIAKGGSAVIPAGAGARSPAGTGTGAGAGAGKPGPAGAAGAANKGAAGAGAGKATPASGKPGATVAPAKAPGGKHNSEQVRDIIRKVATNPSLGKQSALDVLDQDGGGVTNVTNLKPEHFDAVYEACQVLLSAEGANLEPAGTDDFDPTA